MNMLRRSFAPLSSAQWAAVDDEARAVLQRNLVARTFVDVDGPHGPAHSAYNLGRLGDTVTEGELTWRPREVRPLVELRVPFTLSLGELDDIERGAPDVDLDPVVVAAQAVSRFEEHAIYHGLPAAGIEGLCSAEGAPSKKLPPEPGAILESVAAALVELADAGVEGPYMLVLGEQPFRQVAGTHEGYPVMRQLEELLGARPSFSRGLEGAVLASTRGDDFILSLGIDASVGFDRVDGANVHLYLTESFTFDIPGPEAAVTFAL